MNVTTAREVVEFLAHVGSASPMDVGVCALGHRDGKRAWYVLNELRAEGYVRKPRHGEYRCVHGLAAYQMEIG